MYRDYNQKSFRMLRKSLGLSQSDLANICRTTKQTISNIEKGKVNNSMSITFIGITLENLIKQKYL